jgi:hypothetical protein
MYPEIALKRVVYEVPYLFHFDRVMKEPSMICDAGHYVFNAVAEFVCPETVRLIAYESSLAHLSPTAIEMFIYRYSREIAGRDRNVRHDEDGTYQEIFHEAKGHLECEWLQSMRLFPIEDLPLLVSWEKKFPRYEWLLKHGLGRADHKPPRRRIDVHKKEAVSNPV